MKNFYNSPIKVPECAYIEMEAVHAPFPKTLNDTYYVQKGRDVFASNYLRIAGGTTWHWLGTSIRFLPEDFQMKKNYGVGVDWPIQYHDLEPWYSAAEKELGVAGHNGEDLGSPRSSNYPLPEIPHTYLDRYFIEQLKNTDYKIIHTPQARNSIAFDNRPSCCGSSSCIPCCPIQAKYDATVHLKKAIKAGAELITDAVAFKIDSNSDGEITQIHFKRPDKTIDSISGKTFMIAANAIESAKLLLMSKSDAFTNGIANSSDQVGRNLSDHPEILVYGLASVPVYPYRGPNSTAGIDTTRRGDFRKTRAAYRVEFLNDGWDYPEGGFQPLLESLIQTGLKGSELEKAFKDIAARQVTVACLTEQLPHSENRIVPSKEKYDAIGIPQPEIYYSLDEYTKAGHRAAIVQMKEILTAAGCTALKPSQIWYGAGHIMGTYRMGNDPRSSVVNSDLKSHDHKNLYLLGSGVFPTMGSANPTLTIAALSLKCSHHILKNYI